MTTPTPLPRGSARAATEATPIWLDEMVARYGEPRVNIPEPVKLGDRKRRCRGWFINGGNHYLTIDDFGGHWVIAAGTPEMRAEVSIFGHAAGVPPTDEMVRQVLVLGGLVQEA